MKLTTLLSPERVLWAPSVHDKWELIDRLIQVMPTGSAGFRGDLGALKASILERERQLTTGLERGLAIPHGMTEGSAAVAAFALMPRGINFESLDGVPAHYVCAVAFPSGPDGRKQHLDFLHLAARLFVDPLVRQELDAAKSPREILDILRRGESRLGIQV